MEDLLKYKDAQIEALQRRLNDIEIVLREMLDDYENNN